MGKNIQSLVAAFEAFRVLPYRLELRRKDKNGPGKTQRDHILRQGLVSSTMRNLLKREHGMIKAKNRLPFAVSCMVASER
jgi:hypothetical protein